MKTNTSQNAHRDGGFRYILASEGILPEVEVLALKRVVCRRIGSAALTGMDSEPSLGTIEMLK